MLFSGCATWSDRGITPGPQKLRLAVHPIETEVHPRHVGDLRTLPPGAAAPEDEKQAVRDEIEANAKYLESYLHRRLGSSHYFQIVAAADSNQAAQVILETHVSGYGHIKTKWKVYLIGSGVIEGVTQGIIAAQFVNPWIAIAIAAEEILSETITWGGGSYLFDRFYSPVILEAQLVNATNGAAFWDGTVFVSINRKGLKNYPDEDRSKKEIRLRVTAEKAIAELVSDINNAARRQFGATTNSVPARGTSLADRP